MDGVNLFTRTLECPGACTITNLQDIIENARIDVEDNDETHRGGIRLGHVEAAVVEN